MDDAKEILNRVRQLVRVIRAYEKEAQARHGLGAAQMFILHVLANEPELSLNDVADRTATDQSSASLAVGRLVDEGLVLRETRSDDRRQVRLSLTKEGRAVVRRAPPAVQQRIMEGVKTLSKSDRNHLVSLLDKLLSGLPQLPGRPPMFFQDEPARRRTTAKKPSR